jgi:hypothetical protein
LRSGQATVPKQGIAFSGGAICSDAATLCSQIQDCLPHLLAYFGDSIGEVAQGMNVGDADAVIRL